MNRYSNKIVVVTLAGLFLSGLTAEAKVKQKKKDFNLKKNPLANLKSEQPDKILFDKAMKAMDKGHYDVARLDLQTLLNTYPESEYQMRAKLAVGDTWYKEGGAAALTQAEAEYEDFITFFPDAPEAAEAKMKVADIYYQQMNKPDRDFTNAMQAEREYREMINMFPNSSLIPRAKQRLREVQEVLAEREAQIGWYYQSRQNYPAAIARLETVANTYPLYSKSDQVWLAIGDCYAGEAQQVQLDVHMPGAARERLQAMYQNKAASAYDKVIERYPMAPHVEDARDRLVAMNRPVPQPSQSAIAQSDAEVRSEQPLRFTDFALGIFKHGPTVVEAVHVGEPTLTDPPRTLATQINQQNVSMFKEAMNERSPVADTAQTPTPANEPPRTDRPSAAPEAGRMAPGSGTGMGVQVISAPSNGQAAAAQQSDPNALVQPVGPKNTALPAATKPAEAPVQINDIKTAPPPQPIQQPGAKAKKPKVDLSSESSSKKKKKRGLHRLNPF